MIAEAEPFHVASVAHDLLQLNYDATVTRDLVFKLLQPLRVRAVGHRRWRPARKLTQPKYLRQDSRMGT